MTKKKTNENNNAYIIEHVKYKAHTKQQVQDGDAHLEVLQQAPARHLVAIDLLNSESVRVQQHGNEVA